MHSGTNTLLCLHSRCQIFASMSCTGIDTVQTSFKGRWLHFEAPGEGCWSLMIFFQILWSDMTQRHPILAISSVVLWQFVYTSRQGAWTAGCIISLFHDLYIRGPTVTSWSIFCGEVPGGQIVLGIHSRVEFAHVMLAYAVINMLHVVLIRMIRYFNDRWFLEAWMFNGEILFQTVIY